MLKPPEISDQQVPSQAEHKKTNSNHADHYKKWNKNPFEKGLHTKQKEIMNVENTKAQMRKGVLEYCILSILNGHDKYASEILKTLKDAKMLVVEGTIYPLLTRLKNAGLLNYRWEESTSGPPRKYYTLTETGKLFLKELDTTWDELRKATNLVTQNK